MQKSYASTSLMTNIAMELNYKEEDKNGIYTKKAQQNPDKT